MSKEITGIKKADLLANSRREFLKGISLIVASCSAAATPPQILKAVLHEAPNLSKVSLKGLYNYGLSLLENKQGSKRVDSSVQALPFIKSALNAIDQSSSKIPIKEIINASQQNDLERIKKIEKNFQQLQLSINDNSGKSPLVSIDWEEGDGEFNITLEKESGMLLFKAVEYNDHDDIDSAFFSFDAQGRLTVLEFEDEGLEDSKISIIDYGDGDAPYLNVHAKTSNDEVTLEETKELILDKVNETLSQQVTTTPIPKLPVEVLEIPAPPEPLTIPLLEEPSLLDSESPIIDVESEEIEELENENKEKQTKSPPNDSESV